MHAIVRKKSFREPFRSEIGFAPVCESRQKVGWVVS